MPTPKQPNGAKKLPTCPNNRVTKPTVMYGKDPVGADSLKLWSFPVLDSEKLFLVLPMPTKRAALAKKKWEAMGREKKVEAMAEEMHTDWRAAHGVPGCERWEMLFENQKEPYRRSALAVVRLIQGESTP